MLCSGFKLGSEESQRKVIGYLRLETDVEFVNTLDEFAHLNSVPHEMLPEGDSVAYSTS